MDIKELENWLWDIASILRGPVGGCQLLA
jgi:hypothetical protein